VDINQVMSYASEDADIALQLSSVLMKEIKEKILSAYTETSNCL